MSRIFKRLEVGGCRGLIMIFVALYVNTENELCTVLKDSFYIIYGKKKEQMHSFYDVMKFIADDFVKFIEVNKKQGYVTTNS